MSSTATLDRAMTQDVYVSSSHLPGDDELPYRPLRLRSTRQMERDQRVWLRFVGEPDLEAQDAVMLRAAEDYLALAVPGATPKGTRPYDEELVDVAFNRFNDGRYTFRTRVVKVPDSFDGVVCLAHTEQLSRTQQRQYVRVEMEGDVRFAPISEARLLARMLTGRAAPGKEQCMGRMADLSGGGCGIRASTAVPDGELLLLWLDFLPAAPLVEVPAQIVGVSPLAVDDAVMHRLHLKFRHIPEALRQAIIQYVFERQLLLPQQ